MSPFYGTKEGFTSIIAAGLGSGGFVKRSICRQTSSAGPMAQCVDLFAHGHGQWRRGFQRVDDSIGGQLAFGGEGIVERGDNGLFYFRATIRIGGGRERGDIEVLGIALALLQ